MSKSLLFLFAISISICNYAQKVETLIDEAEFNLSKNHLEKSKDGFNELIRDRLDELSDLQAANIYNNLGYLNLVLLEPEKAKENLDQSISYHKGNPETNSQDYANALFNTAQYHLEHTYDYDLAKANIEEGISLLAEAGADDSEIALANTKLAILYEEAGYYNLAMNIFEESYNVLIDAQTNILNPDFAEVCSHMGRILIRNGRTREAEEYINQSSDIYRQLGPDFDVQRAESLEDLGMFYERIGRFNEAERILLQALALKETIPDEADVLIVESINDLGVLYYNYANYSKAKSMFLDVLERCKNSNVGTQHEFYATALNNLANISIAEEDYLRARIYLKESLSIYEKKFGQNHPLYATTLNNLARVERAEGNTRKAEEYYRQCLGIDEKIYGRNHPDFATTLMNLAVLYSATGREVEAEGYYKEALLIRKDVLGDDHPDYGKSLERLGLHSMIGGDMELAETYFREAIEIQINQIKLAFPVMTETEREYFYRSIKNGLDRYNYVAMDLLEEKPDLLKVIFDFQIKTKAILFNTSSKVRTEVENSTDPELQKLYSDWQSKKKLLSNYLQMGVKDREAHGISLLEMENEVETLEKQLVRAIDDFKKVVPQENENWQAVQSKVKDEEAIVEIIKIREFKSVKTETSTLFGFTDFSQYLAIIFSNKNEEPTYEILGGSYRTDDAHYAQYRNAMLYGVSQVDTYNLFWKPIEKHIGKVNKVTVSPDGIFYKMNLNAVEIPGERYLIDKYFISYITSCKDLFSEELINFNQKGYFFGNPNYGNSEMLSLTRLEGSEKEVSQITELLESENWSAIQYIQNDASELRLRSAFRPQILHIATHGFFGEKGNFLRSLSPIDDPLFNSGIYLSGVGRTYDDYLLGYATTPTNDGILTAYEAMNLDLNATRLVVLSACESGLGEIENGEGVYGLQRAFMVAGARNIITSFIKVDDEATSELMVAFYQKFTETDRVDEAMRYAQLKLKETYNDPKIWGAFILTGNG